MQSNVQPKYVEQITLVASVIKWSFYATIVGGLAGGATTLFLKILNWSSARVGAYPNYYYFLPVAILGSSLMVKWLAPEAEGHGTEKVIEAIHERMGRIPFIVVPVKLVATVITLAVGGSAGKESPCAQIGAGISSSVASVLRLDDVDRRKLVICGISAGFATVFGTPIAGALFGVEVLVLGQMFYDVLFPSFVAGIVGYHVATNFGIVYERHPACQFPILTSTSMLEVILLGIFCGLVALFLVESMRVARKLFHKLGPIHYQALLGGVLVVLIGRFISVNYLGLGLDTIGAGLSGVRLPVGSVFWKTLATSITLGCGGSGGDVTPVFFIGTSAGNLFAQLFHEPYVAAFSGMGMVAMLAGAANTPIAASVLAMELFGPGIAPYSTVACMVSFLVVGYRSIYPSQVLGMQKSASLAGETGRPIGETPAVTVVHREKSLMGVFVKGVKMTRHQHQKKDNHHDE